MDSDRGGATGLLTQPPVPAAGPASGSRAARDAARDPMLPAACEVVRVRRETADTQTIALSLVNGELPAPFEPGQFNMIYAFGVGEVPISISGDPARTDRVIHTTRRVGAVTQAICAARRGTILGLRGPFGSAWPVAEAHGRDLIIIAGGIGLAPLRPAIYRVLANREKFRRVSVLYGSRTDGDLLFRRELAAWRARLDVELEVTVDRGGSGWNGNVGVVTPLIGRAAFEPANTIAMICGPEVMMRFAIVELRNRGVSQDHIFVSMERNMKCGIGLCGHCQFGPEFICKDGPIFRYSRIRPWFDAREV